MNAIILVGGLGTRLRPLTLKRPKALLPLLNRPFLNYQLDILRSAKIKNVVLSAGVHNKPFEKDFRKLCPFGMKFIFSYEAKPLGTAGGIRHAFDFLRGK